MDKSKGYMFSNQQNIICTVFAITVWCSWA